MLQYSECDEEFRMWDSRLDVEVKKAIKVRYGKVSELSLNINSFLMEEESSDLGKPSNLRKVTSFWLGFVFVFCFWSVLLEWNDYYFTSVLRRPSEGELTPSRTIFPQENPEEVIQESSVTISD